MWQIKKFFNITIIFFGFLYGSAYGSCSPYNKLMEEKKFEKIVADLALKQNIKNCEKNILALANLESKNRREGLKLLSELSEIKYAPATYNLANEIIANKDYEAEDAFILLKEAFFQSAINDDYIVTFNYSWDAAHKLISGCERNVTQYCDSLVKNTLLVNDFFYKGGEILKLAHLKHKQEFEQRRATEQQILFVMSLGLIHMTNKIENSTESLRASRAAKVVKPLPPSTMGNSISGTFVTVGRGVSPKTASCIVGHIALGSPSVSYCR
jgi:hypothetical protein